MSTLFGTPTLADIAESIRNAYATLGGKRIDLPNVQPLVPYLEFLGEAYRQNIVEHGGDDLCLCPDLTLALALQIATGQSEAGIYQFDGLVFRGSRMDQTASPVQRQIGVEVFSSSADILDDSNIVLATKQAIEDAGVDNYSVTFADAGLVFGLIDSFDLHENWKSRLKKSFSMPSTFERDLANASAGATAPALPRALAKLKREDAREALADMFDMVKIAPFGARSLDDITDRLIDKASESERPLKSSDAETLSAISSVKGDLQTALSELSDILNGRDAIIDARLVYWQDMQKQLTQAGMDLSSARFDANLGRELSYYDGFVFECHASNDVFLGGGGRYDSLITSLSNGKKESRAVGAIVRPDRIARIIEGGA